ncbi:MAG TPA: ABC transporter permease [Candidatus Dormibacteraeota bacterium]|nr:ABC transporter permease [Candidatus Dormibacteraeota bacterium]
MAACELREESGGRVLLKLSGSLNAESTAACWRDLERRLHGMRPTSVEVELSETRLAGAIGAALLRYIAEGGMTPGAKVVMRGLSEQAEKVLQTFTVEDFRAARPQPHKPSIPTEAGEFTRLFWEDVKEQIAFFGTMVTALPSAWLHPKRMRWGEVRRVMEIAGANALPVVAIISGMVGMVTVLEAAHPLARFGAQIFLADVIGFSSVRDTGPVVTAILLAGRSGSAFAAELGTMKVNQELDALTTMGLDPIRFLVVQRVTAALLVTPLLTIYAMLMGILGGLVVMRSLGFPPMMIMHQLSGRVGMSDIGVGLTKSAIFGVIVGGMGALRGLQTGEGPSAVGNATTRSVIACILLIILANTLYSSLLYFWQ